MEHNPLPTFITLLEQIGVPYWLDSGSLLGIHRERRLLPWDHDIDIGMWASDMAKVQSHASDIVAQGFILDFQYYHNHLYNIECKVRPGLFEREIPIHLHGYMKKDGYAHAPQIIVCDPKPALQPDWAIENPSSMRDFLLLCKREAIAARDGRSSALRKLAGLLFAYPVWGLLCMVRNPMDRTLWVDRWPFKLLYRINTWRIPEQYFTSLEKISVEGTAISVPGNIEAYLTYRYGNWQVPNPDWVYWRDDAALLDREPQAFGVW